MAQANPPHKTTPAVLDRPPAGDRVHICPLCGYRGRFKAHKRSGRPNASCGRCGARERHRLVALYLRGVGAERWTGAWVLHVSPEYFFAPFFSKAALYLTADLTDPKADLHTDLSRMGIADHSFDAMMCNHVLEHVADEPAAIAEIYRILKPGGLALISVPLDDTLERTYEDPAVTSPEGRETQFGQADHLRRYGRDFPSRLARAGFGVSQFRATPHQGKAYAIHKNTIIFVARKPG